MKYLIKSTKAEAFLYEYTDAHPLFHWTWRLSEQDATKYETKADAEEAIRDYRLKHAQIIAVNGAGEVVRPLATHDARRKGE